MYHCPHCGKYWKGHANVDRVIHVPSTWEYIDNKGYTEKVCPNCMRTHPPRIKKYML